MSNIRSISDMHNDCGLLRNASIHPSAFSAKPDYDESIAGEKRP